MQYITVAAAAEMCSETVKRTFNISHALYTAARHENFILDRYNDVKLSRTPRVLVLPPCKMIITIKYAPCVTTKPRAVRRENTRIENKRLGRLRREAELIVAGTFPLGYSTLQRFSESRAPGAFRGG